jgi:IBR domain, a half RING-finger domain
MTTTTATSTPSSTPTSSQQDDMTVRLSDDLASVRRVRNRLSNTTDDGQQLPKILSGLVPRLFRRLEDYARMTDVNKSEHNAGLLQQQQQQTIKTMKSKVEYEIFGILASGIERLKGNNSYNPQQQQLLPQIVPAMLPFLNSDRGVVVAWAITFLNVSFQQRSMTRSIQKRQQQQLDWPATMRSLIIALEKSHSDLTKIRKNVPDDTVDALPSNAAAATEKALASRFSRISWLVLDCIMLLGGYRPIVDWDMDEFEPKTLQYPNLLDDKPTRLAIVESLKSAFRTGGEDGVGDGTSASLISLILDLVLFWPDGDQTSLSAVGLQRMFLRGNTNIVDDDDAVDVDEHGFGGLRREQANLRNDIPVQFQRQLRQRQPTSRWCESAKIYLRYLKMNAIKLALWPVDDALFQPDLLDGKQECQTAQFDDRAVFIALLTANADSMHGRVAMDFVKQWRSCIESPKSTAAQLSTVRLPVLLSLVCAILILFVGESEASELLEEFETTNGEGCWQKILGPIQRNKSMQRPQLPCPIAQFATASLLRSVILWTGDASVDASYSSLLIRVAVKQIHQGDKHQKNMAIRLVSWIYLQLKSPSQSIVPPILDSIPEILQMVVEVGEADREELRILQPGQLPGGVPAPFDRRHDLNRLLSSHRSALKRKNMASDDALNARKEAYKLIELLAPSVLKWEKNQDKPFVLPRLLLTCSSYEDARLKPFVVKALEALLQQYELLHNDTLNISESVVSLLPAIVEAMLSHEEIARRTAMVWIQRLLVRRDVEASIFLCSRFSKDEDTRVARIANEVISSHSFQVDGHISNDKPIKFLPFNDGEGPGAILIRNDLQHRIQSLHEELLITNDESTVFMIEKSFSSTDAAEAYRANREEIRHICGLMDTNEDDDKMDTDNDLVCGICYDDDEDLCNDGMFSLSCQHTFCRPCWSSYIHNESRSKHQSFLDLRCPQHDCHSRLLPSHIRELATSPHDFSRWESALLETFIESQPNMRHCPGPGCGCVAIIRGSNEPLLAQQTGQITCDNCSTSFCFQCGDKPHRPASCQDMKEWHVLMAKSDVSKKLLSKPCPGCHSFIEKNAGCNHMKCTQCGTDFCWVCLKLLERHLQQHQCKPYDPSSAAENDYERHALFTASRYQAHDDARQFALNQLRTFVAEKLVESFWFLDEDEDPEILRRALSTLTASRLFLMNSYIAMLGLRGGDGGDDVDYDDDAGKESEENSHRRDQHQQQRRFTQHELHHSCLEMFTERLAQLTETNLQRLYLEQGQYGVMTHFRKLDFYDATVVKYMDRINNL